MRSGRGNVKNMKKSIYFAIMMIGQLLAAVPAKTVFPFFWRLLYELRVISVIADAARQLRQREA